MAVKEKYRHEMKYEISYGEYMILRQKLSLVMKLDKHCGKEGKYHIHSLYFDNYNDKALKEKLDGVSKRDKYRIRFYDDNDRFIMLEKKSKHNSLCLKKSCQISREECDRILNGETEWMQEDLKRPLLQEFYRMYQSGMLRPKTIVSYTRVPFIYTPGNVRVTFDMDIRSGMYHTNLFDKTQPTITALPGGRMILEVKYDEFLPDIIKMLIQSGTPRIGAFSKYAACRQYE